GASTPAPPVRSSRKLRSSGGLRDAGACWQYMNDLSRIRQPGERATLHGVVARPGEGDAEIVRLANGHSLARQLALPLPRGKREAVSRDRRPLRSRAVLRRQPELIERHVQGNVHEADAIWLAGVVVLPFMMGSSSGLVPVMKTRSDDGSHFCPGPSTMIGP